MKEKYIWKIECDHTPETIDRILLPIRKRGLCVLGFEYRKKDETSAFCTLEFEMEPANVERVYKNLIRIQDIRTVTR